MQLQMEGLVDEGLSLLLGFRGCAVVDSQSVVQCTESEREVEK